MSQLPDTAGPDTTGPETTGPRSGKPLLTAAVLLLLLIGTVTLLVLVFQPFADAAGGCGGG